MSVRMRILFIVGMALMVLGGVCLAVLYTRAVANETSERQRSDILAQDAKSHLRIGMSRDEALRQMGEAWRHYECNNGGFDIFLFGSRNPDWADIVSLLFDREDDKLILARIATEESYRLNVYENCVITER